MYSYAPYFTKKIPNWECVFVPYYIIVSVQIRTFYSKNIIASGQNEYILYAQVFIFKKAKIVQR
jgi:hypothetical protein